MCGESWLAMKDSSTYLGLKTRHSIFIYVLYLFLPIIFYFLFLIWSVVVGLLSSGRTIYIFNL